jgi:hypothetical protein
MQFTVKNIRVEKQFEGPDAVKFRLVAPSGAEIDLIEEVPNGDGEKFVRSLGPCEYDYFEAKRGEVEFQGRKRAKTLIVEETRNTEG